MKSSYKISLLVATVLCVVVVLYYARQTKPNEAAATIEHQTPRVVAMDDTPSVVVQPAPRPTPTPAAPVTPRVPELRLDGAAAAPAPAPASTVPATYTVKSGDNLARIAVEVFGHERYWDEIAKANPTIDPARLKVGQVLKLPGKETIERGGASDEPEAAAPGETFEYVVQAGDTLSDIARAYYSDPSRWQYLYNVNRAVIGKSPNALKAGTRLKIPPLPTAAE